MTFTVQHFEQAGNLHLPLIDGKSEQNDALCGEAKSIDQLTKVFVLCDDKALLVIGTRKQLGISRTAQFFHHIQHIVSVLAQGVYNAHVAALIDKEFHIR